MYSIRGRDMVIVTLVRVCVMNFNMHVIMLVHTDLFNGCGFQDDLIFHVGPRRFSASPVFSQHTQGDKHKVKTVFRAFTEYP